MKKLGIFILSHNRPDLLKRALGSIDKSVFREVFISDNSDTEFWPVVKDIALQNEVYISRCSTKGLIPNLINAIEIMKDDVSYLLLCDDDEIVLNNYTEVNNIPDCAIYAIPALQEHMVGFKNFKRGRTLLLKEQNTFPNLGFAGMFIPARIYKDSICSIEKFGNRFDLFLLSQVAGLKTYISCRNHYKFNQHEDQLSSNISWESIHLFLKNVILDSTSTEKKYFLFISLIAIYYEIKHKLKVLWRG